MRRGGSVALALQAIACSAPAPVESVRPPEPPLVVATPASAPAPAAAPALEPPARVTALAMGQEHACALWSSGRVSCWGAADRMQVGRVGQRRARPALVPGIASAVEIGAGGHVSCARLEDGSAWCWGSDFAGGLGDGDERLAETCSAHGCSATPRRVQGIDRAIRLELGSLVHCAVEAEGQRRCWGSNEYGLYAPKEVSRLHEATPLPPGVPDATAWDAAVSNVCGVGLDGGLWCLGDDAMGRLGDGRSFHVPCWRRDVDCTATSVVVRGLSDVAEVALGGDFACARLHDGRVACWGEGEAGQLGDGLEIHSRCQFADVELDCSRSPVMVKDLHDAVELTCGTWHCCARTKAGAVRCWGDNDAGQLGVEQSADRCNSATRKPFDCSRAPVTVPGLSNVVDLAAGSHASCAITAGGEVWCWGADAGGQLGDGGEARCRKGKRHVSSACSKVPLRVPLAHDDREPGETHVGSRPTKERGVDSVSRRAESR